jgi:hypothetical protein
MSVFKEKNAFGAGKRKHFEISERIHLYRNIIEKKVSGTEKRIFE